MIEIGKRSAYLGKASPSSEGMSNGGVEILSPLSDFALNFIQGSVTPGEWAVVFGESPLSLPDAVSTHLDYIKAFGKCAQADTPTPTVPVDIVCNNGAIKVKDDELPVGYKRLQDIHFDGNCYYETDEKLYGNDVITLTLQADSAGGQNIFGAYSGTGADASNLSLYIYSNTTGGSYFRANQTLLRPTLGTGKRTISFGNGSTSGFYKDVTYDVEEFETTDTAQIGALPNSSSPKFTGYLYGNITIGNRLKYIPCERVSDSAIGYYETVNGEFLENQGTGTLTTSGYDTSHLTEIYYDGTVETVIIENNLMTTFKERTAVRAGNISAESPLGSEISSNSYSCSDYIKVKPNTNYTTTNPNYQAAAAAGLVFYGAETVESAISGVPLTTQGGSIYSFTTPSNCNYIRFSWKNDKGNNAKLVEDSAISSATCQPLLSVGTYKDVQNITNGAITRNVGIKVIDGTENWTQTGSGTNYTKFGTSDIISAKGGSEGVSYSTHLVCSYANTSGNFYWSANVNSLQVIMTDGMTVDDFKAWLAQQYAAGTPVIVVYPLAEPTTETVTGQTLTITKGDNVISAEGSLTGLELEAKYKKAS